MKTLLLILLLSTLPVSASVPLSMCYGSTANGKLVNGVQLPAKGNNYVGYSTVARIAGRTYVHSTVKQIIVATYADLEKEQPTKVYKYAETGFKEGGLFKPHKTHRNGLSVDFMTPVKDVNGKSVHLPTTPLNKFGYSIEFDKQGRYENVTIDYDAMAAHIVMLHRNATAFGYNLWRVIFDPTLQPNLFKTQYGSYLKKNIQFSKKPSWVRHDEHYHVDFVVPCK